MAKQLQVIGAGWVRHLAAAVLAAFFGQAALAQVSPSAAVVDQIGSLLLDYYSVYDNKTIQGKLSAIDGTIIGYYTSFDDRVLIGKLKSVGGTTITYYSSFDDKFIRGKIKNIGPVSYTWYTSLESQYGGGLKTGSYRQSIGGVTYILQ